MYEAQLFNKYKKAGQVLFATCKKYYQKSHEKEDSRHFCYFLAGRKSKLETKVDLTNK